MEDLIKVIKGGDHSLISNYHLRDKRLSWSAKGLLTTLLALSGEYTFDELERMSYNGFIGIMGFAELEKCGYLIRRQCGADSGCPVLEYTIYEKPITNRPAWNSVAEIMDPEDMPVSAEAIDEAEKQKLEERLQIDDLVKSHSKRDSFYICVVKAAFYELCKRDADFRNMMTAIAFKKVCDAVGEWQAERIKIESDSAIIHLINKAFDNIQEAQKGSRKRQNVTMEI